MEKDAYRVFVSHTGVDAPIAKAVRRVLADAFPGFLQLHLATEDNEPGETWKEELRRRLRSYDALISIITPESFEKPWIYVEWSPFWVENKQIFILTHGEIRVEQLIGPMHDRQYGAMLDQAYVSGLFGALNRVCGAEAVGYQPSAKSVDEFLKAVAQGITEKSENHYGIYRQTLDTLPASDLEKRRIAEYFYGQREYDVFLGIVKRLRSDHFKADIARAILEDSETDPKVELELAVDIATSVDSSNEIRCIAVCLIDRGAIDTVEMRHIVQQLAEQNRTELRRLCQHLIEKDMDDTTLFEDIIQILAEDAPTELRNLGFFMVRNEYMDRLSFAATVNAVIAQEKYIHMRELAALILKQRVHRQYVQFIECIDALFRGNRDKQIRPLFELFVEIDREYARQLLMRQDQSKAIVIELLKALGNLERLSQT